MFCIMEESNKAKIIADLEKSGFLSELQARQIVQHYSGHWNCFGSMSFFDLDEHKLRQVDLYAVMPCGDRVGRENHTHTVWTLVGEIKKSERPWVVLKDRHDVLVDYLRQKDQLLSYYNFPGDPVNLIGAMHRASYSFGYQWIGCGLHESFKSPSESSRPYSAFVAVVKAAEHFHREYSKSTSGREKLTFDIQKNPTHLNFIQPIVIVDGQLYGAEVDKAGKVNVEELDMAPMIVSFRSPNYARENYRIDIVRLSALRDYLSMIENQHNEIRKLILNLGGVSSYTEAELINGAKAKSTK